MGADRCAWWTWLVGVALAAVTQAAAAAPIEHIETIRIGTTTQRVLVAWNDAAPVERVVITFPGGDGALGLKDTPPGAPSPEQGYISTLRRDLVRPGTALVLVDVLSGRPGMPLADRESAGHRTEIAQLLAHLRSRFAGAALYLLGYSNGAVSALVAARDPGVAGVILVSGIFLRYADVAGFNVEVPLLVVHHEVDRCVAPDFDESFRLRLRPSMVRSIAQPYGPSACAPLSAHQLYGQEAAVAEAVHQWLLTGRAPSRIR